MARLIAVVLLLFVLSACAYAGGIKDGSLSGYSNGSNIVLRWVSDDEQNVIEFRIERRTGASGPFIQLTEISPRGNGSSYEYIDNSVFRTTDSFYQYRITAVGTRSDPWYVTVSHSTSSVRRTWGSIKAMFR
jgi:hypothetical protein